MKQLIINADDYGWDEDANKSIIKLAISGKITSTTIMANMVSDNALAEVLKLPISIGWHINLIAGPPVSPKNKVKSLLNDKGLFCGNKVFLKRLFAYKISPQHVVLELEAQLARLQNAGIVVSHADSHQHLHQYPFISKLVHRVLSDRGIKRVRNCNVIFTEHRKMAALKLFHLFSSHYQKNFRTVDGLIPVFSFQKPSLDLFEKVIVQGFEKYDSLEFMTHPAMENRSDSYLNRVLEHDFWNSSGDSDKILSNFNIKKVSYADI